MNTPKINQEIKEQIRQSIKALVQAKTSVDFFELSKHVEGFAGDYVYYFPRAVDGKPLHYTQIPERGIRVTWDKLSLEAIEVLDTYDAKDFFMWPEDTSCYPKESWLALPCLFDDIVINDPKITHWCPAILRNEPY